VYKKTTKETYADTYISTKENHYRSGRGEHRDVVGVEGGRYKRRGVHIGLCGSAQMQIEDVTPDGALMHGPHMDVPSPMVVGIDIGGTLP
jgi:hypothetical protein